MRQAAAGLSVAGLTLAACAAADGADVSSAYTEFDRERDCTIVARAPGGESDVADYLCPGWGEYDVLIHYGDARERIAYGFGAAPGMPGILPFNGAHDTIEWRLRGEGDSARPFAAIQRWLLEHPPGIDAPDQILVVSRVAQPGEGGGACAVAFLDAGDANANDRARGIADERAEAFDCGAEAPAVDESIRGMVGGAAGR